SEPVLIERWCNVARASSLCAVTGNKKRNSGRRGTQLGKLARIGRSNNCAEEAVTERAAMAFSPLGNEFDDLLIEGSIADDEVLNFARRRVARFHKGEDASLELTGGFDERADAV